MVPNADDGPGGTPTGGVGFFYTPSLPLTLIFEIARSLTSPLLCHFLRRKLAKAAF